jgi:hypothetical protein
MFQNGCCARDGCVLGFYTMLWLNVAALGRTHYDQLYGDWTGSAGCWSDAEEERKYVVFSQVILWKQLICCLKERGYKISMNKIVSPCWSSSYLTSIPCLTWIKSISGYHQPLIGHNIFTSPTALCPWKRSFFKFWIPIGLGQPYHLFLLLAAVNDQIPPNFPA